MKKGNGIVLVCVLLVVIVLGSCKKTDDSATTANVSATEQAQNRNTLVALFNMAGYGNPAQLQVLDSQMNVITEIATPSAVLNFQKWIINGQVRYTYTLFDPAASAIAGVGYVPGTDIILDENMKQLKAIKLMAHNDHGELPVDGHEFVLLGDDHYIAIAYYEKKVTNIETSLNPVAGGTIVTPVIQEVQGGNVMWEWQGSDYPEFYANSVEGNDFTNATMAQDYMHLNSIVVDPKDNNLVCSFRNQNQVVKLNRTTGDIVWRLGGKNSDFVLPASQKFLRQHHVTITSDGNLLMVDNGDFTERAVTRIAEFKIDESSKTIVSYSGIYLPDNKFCQYMGSVQKSGDTYFIGCGSLPEIIEMNYKTKGIIADTKLSATSYRALRY